MPRPVHRARRVTSKTPVQPQRRPSTAVGLLGLGVVFCFLTALNPAVGGAFLAISLGIVCLVGAMAFLLFALKSVAFLGIELTVLRWLVRRR